MTEKTEAAHTPGPWNKHRTVTGDIAVIGKDCTLVARIARESPNGFADAALIASAPDLAAQLDEAGAIARELVEAGNKLYCLCPEGGSYTDEALERWDAAIARAGFGDGE